MYSNYNYSLKFGMTLTGLLGILTYMLTDYDYSSAHRLLDPRASPDLLQHVIAETCEGRNNCNRIALRRSRKI